jgi:hypothetical protein
MGGGGTTARGGAVGSREKSPARSNGERHAGQPPRRQRGARRGTSGRIHSRIFAALSILPYDTAATCRQRGEGAERRPPRALGRDHRIGQDGAWIWRRLNDPICVQPHGRCESRRGARTVASSRAACPATGVGPATSTGPGTATTARWRRRAPTSARTAGTPACRDDGGARRATCSSVPRVAERPMPRPGR